jgi:protein-S-isoprenylcysteine O-methyltransferase Ste14
MRAIARAADAPPAHASLAPSDPEPRRLPAPLRPVVALWRGLVRLYRDVESTPWGQLLLSNVWPAYLFAMPLAAKVWFLGNRIASGAVTAGGSDTLHRRAQVVQDLATVLFFGVVVVLFIVRRPVVGQRAQWWGGAIALGGTFILNVVGFLPVPETTSTSLLLVSSVVVLLGTAVAVWSLLSLGQFFGIQPQVRGLALRGPYRWVRHPLYLGELISGLGLVIAKPSVPVALFYVLFLALQVERTILEEKALSRQFPREYTAYRGRTGRLLPKWR